MRCKICRTEFTRRSMTHKTCSTDCALAYVAVQNSKKLKKKQMADRKETKLKLEKLKTRSQYLEDTQKACNGLVRTRDLKAGHGCISCGSMTSYPRWQAGHLFSVGAHPNRRFNLDNIHLQCVHCNMHLGGSALKFYAALVVRIGRERVEKLESDNAPAKWTIPELIEMKKKFQQMKKELENE